MDQQKSDHSLKIFYAWQDDLPRGFNRFAIRNALDIAAAHLTRSLSIESGNAMNVLIDEATRDLSGSPHIPTSILKKIQTADIFVADVTTVMCDRVDARKAPNANVVFELGYALSYLGWERILLLVNDAHGSVLELPFDFDRQRASHFKSSPGISDSQLRLNALIIEAVGLIVKKNPARPKSLHFDADQAKRERDFVTLSSLLEYVHLPTIDDHIARGAKYLTVPSTNLYEFVNEIAAGSAFHLYDQDLRKAVDAFVHDWGDSMKYDHYFPSKSGHLYVFTSDWPGNKKIRADFEYMDKARIRLRASKDTLLDLIRTKFPEIDVQAASDAAGAKYNSDMADIDQRFDEAGQKSRKRGKAGAGRKRK